MGIHYSHSLCLDAPHGRSWCNVRLCHTANGCVCVYGLWRNAVLVLLRCFFIALQANAEPLVSPLLLAIWFLVSTKYRPEIPATFVCLAAKGSAFVHGRRSHFRPRRSAARDATMRIQKALPRTILPAPSMSPTALPRTFPPAEALRKPKYNEPDLAVETYSQLQPPDTSALVAFAYRIGIASIFSAEDDMPSLVRQALTHSSFAPFHQSHYPNEASPPTNSSLAVMGNSLLGLFATEHVHASYPHLPTRVLKTAVSAYVGPRTCQMIAKEIGAAPLLRWARTVRVFT